MKVGYIKFSANHNSSEKMKILTWNCARVFSVIKF